MIRSIAAIALSLLLTGCASTAGQDLALDTKGVDMSNYQNDLQECQQIAEQQSIAKEAASDALASAVVGAAIGVAVGDSSDWATGGAKWGAIQGAADGVESGFEKKHTILKNCLRGRGYKVLN